MQNLTNLNEFYIRIDYKYLCAVASSVVWAQGGVLLCHELNRDPGYENKYDTRAITVFSTVLWRDS